MVGAQGVDRDQEHVQPVPGRDRRRDSPPSSRPSRPGPGQPARAAAPATTVAASPRLTPPPRSRCAARRRPRGRDAPARAPLHGTSRSRSAHSTARTPRGPGSSSRPSSPLVAVAAKPVEVGVVQGQAPRVRGEQDEGRARDLVGVGPEAAGQAAHERGLPRPELAGEQDHLAAAKRAPPSPPPRSAVSASPRVVTSRMRHLPARGATRSRPAGPRRRRPAVSPSSPALAGREVAGSPVDDHRRGRRQQRPVPRQERAHDAGEHVSRARRSPCPGSRSRSPPPGPTAPRPACARPSAPRPRPSRARARSPPPAGSAAPRRSAGQRAAPSRRGAA